MADADGYHLFVADGGSGFAWRPLTTLRPDGFDTGSWTGYSCLTGSGNHVVAVVAPGSFANSPVLRDRGAFAYVVDVPSGTVHPLVGGVALKYYSPGCSSGDSAILTRNLGVDQQGTQLLTVDAARATIAKTVTVNGQITSAVPDGAGAVVGAAGKTLVRVESDNKIKILATAAGQVYDIVSKDKDQVRFLAAKGRDALVYRTSGGNAEQVGRGAIADTALFAGRGGHAILVGHSLDAAGKTAADTVISANVPDRVKTVSLDGQVVIGQPGGRTAKGSVEVRSNRTGRSLSRSAQLGLPARAESALPTQAFPLSSDKAQPRTPKAMTAQSAQTPTCAVPRNSLSIQVPQPGHQQVERAVDLAITGDLNDQRPANYLNMGLAAYTPSGDFGPTPLAGGGHVPAQVYLGILAQESNLNQASWHALPGIPANPLIADYYGSGGTVDQISYENADCGYGVGQVTTGMRAADTSPYSKSGKLKIAVDYEENIAAGLQILSDKWNQLAANNITANDGASQYIENWYFAIWAYNTGIQPDGNHGNTTGCTPSPSCTDSPGNWGLGWANNPINPDYPPGRHGFLRDTYADAEHPNSWPYQERVVGWIEYPQRDYEGNDSYSPPAYANGSPAGGNGRQLNIPDRRTFCDLNANHCDPNDAGKQYCLYSDASSRLYDHCWWHQQKSWVSNCAGQCAQQQLSYSPGSPDPGVQNPHPPDCKSTLPGSATIVDDEPDPGLNIAGCGASNWHRSGTFGLTYGTDGRGDPLGEIDTHQLGVGFGGHLYFTHNVKAADTVHKVTGTWTVSLPNHLYNVYVHVPSTGGTTSSAHYQVRGADGAVYDRVVNQHTSEDQWASIGYFSLGANAQVTLDNVTDDLGDNHDVAFDAIGFVPVDGTFQHHTFDSVSVIDPNTNLDTNTPSQFDSPLRNRQTLFDWATERTVGGPPWNDKSKPPVRGLTQIPNCGTGARTTGCVGASTFTAASDWSRQVQEAGTSTSGDKTQAGWMGFTNPRPNPAVSPDQAYGSDFDYKLKTHIDVSFAVDGSGKVVPGSESTNTSTRVGNTRLMPFALAFMQATERDYSAYGVSAPDLGYNEIDANTYTGDATRVDNPVKTGFTPARAYMPHFGGASTDSTGRCAQVKSITGGVDAYRPLDAQAQTNSRVNAWVQQLYVGVQAGRVPQEVADTAGDLYSLLFRAVGVNPPNGSLFNQAPPIWHNIALKFCADGTVSSVQAVPNRDNNPQYGLVYQGYMPDLYLYLDGHMIDNADKPSTALVQRGNFATFSNIPSPTHDTDNAYGNCDVAQRGNGGNPWNISVPPLSAPDDRPHRVRYCDDGQVFMDTYAP